MARCQACRSRAAETEIAESSGGSPYLLCNACAGRLRTRSLRPLEWFNLAALYGPGRHALHDDFYDENGTACQPEQDVVDAELFPAPTLDEVARDLARLVDYSMARCGLDDAACAALRGFDPQDVLRELARRAGDGAEREVVATSYALCGRVVGSAASDWARSQTGRHPLLLFAWTEMAASCLPFADAFERTIADLDRCEVRSLAHQAYALCWFRSAKALDWIQSRFPATRLPVSEDWGRIAALSEFSWPRAADWLQAGRPLSLAALDALNACWHYNTPHLRHARPKLAQPCSRDEAERALLEYQSRDPAPRVRMTVPIILRHWEEICGLSTDG